MWPNGNTLTWSHLLSASWVQLPDRHGSLELDIGYHTSWVGEMRSNHSKQWVTVVEDCGCKLPGEARWSYAVLDDQHQSLASIISQRLYVRTRFYELVGEFTRLFTYLISYSVNNLLTKVSNRVKILSFQPCDLESSFSYLLDLHRWVAGVSCHRGNIPEGSSASAASRRTIQSRRRTSRDIGERRWCRNELALYIACGAVRQRCRLSSTFLRGRTVSKEIQCEMLIYEYSVGMVCHTWQVGRLTILLTFLLTYMNGVRPISRQTNVKVIRVSFET